MPINFMYFVKKNKNIFSGNNFAILALKLFILRLKKI
jgi:hypothetical protein